MEQSTIKQLIKSKAKCFERIDGRIYMVSFASSGECALGGLVFYSGDTLRVMPICKVPYSELLRVVETSQLVRDENDDAMVMDFDNETSTDSDWVVTFRRDKVQQKELILADTIDEARYLFERVHPDLTILKIERMRN